MSADNDELITLREACRLLGGFHVATYYRGAAEGRFPRPVHPSPNISRVSKQQVLETRERIIAGNDGDSGEAVNK
jgi:predicted DNA-binding transcriptional regulator AlpA